MSVLDRLGVREVINAFGTQTTLGGSRLRREALEAMAEVADKFVDIQDLHLKAGRYVAGLVGARDALITNGAAAGLVLCVAAVVTGGDLEKMARIPFVEGLKNEVVVQSPHTVGNPYYPLLGLVGVRVRVAGSRGSTSVEDLERVVGDRTAAIVHFLFEPQEGEVPLGRVVEIAHRRNIPVIVDAAAELPPKENLWRVLGLGADAVVFSGGKEIGGPNDTGVILSNNERLIEWCRRMSYYSYLEVGGARRTFIGRVLKMSKESVVGFVAAFEAYLKEDEGEKLREIGERANRMAAALNEMFPGIKVEVFVNRSGERVRPPLIPKVLVRLPKHSAEEACGLLKNMDPPVYTYTTEEGLVVNPRFLTEKEMKVVLHSLRSALQEVLKTPSKPG